MPGEQKTWTFTLSLSGMITACGTAAVALTLFFILGLLVGRGYRPEQSVPQLADIMPEKHGTTKVPSVLKAEELTYPETLAKAPLQVGQKEEEPPAQKAVQQKKTPPQKTKAKKGEQPKKTEPKKKLQQQKVYDYTYQAASFRKEDMAQALHKKLAGAGLNPAIESATTGKGMWFRVVIKHRGTPDSTATMKATLAKFGITRPLMKRKKLVSQ